MSKALDGLRLGAAGKTIALADVSTADLMANLSDDQKASLAAALAQAPAAPEAGADAGLAPAAAAEGTEPAAPAGEKPTADAAEPGHVQYGHGVASERARVAAVFASEHYEGREALANELIVEGSMSADAIGKVLAKTPKGGGADMLAAMRGLNPDLGQDGGSSASVKDTSALWDRAIKANNPSKRAD